MKLNPNLVLSNLNGTEFLREKDKDVTLGMVCVTALLHPREELGTKKADKYELALRIRMAEDEVEVTAEEIVILKEVIGYSYNALVVGQVYRILEG